MYTYNLQEHLKHLSQHANIEQESITLLEETMACFIGILGDDLMLE